MKTPFYTLMLLVIFSPLAIDIYLPALNIISAEFHVEQAWAKDTITWFMMSMGIGQLIMGPLADRTGRKTVGLLGIVLYLFGSLIGAMATSIELLLVARVIQGVGASATSVSAFASVRDQYGANKSGHYISYLNGVICCVPALAPILGAYLTEWFDWRFCFWFMAVYSVVAGCWLWKFQYETRPKKTAKVSISVDQYFGVLKEPTFLYHSLLCLLAMSVILAYVTAAPEILISQMGLTMSEFTFWFSVNGIINIAACFIGPWLMNRIGTLKTLAIGILAISCSGFLMWAIKAEQAPFAFMLPIFVSSVGFALILGAASGRALAPFGQQAGTAAALLGLLQMTGSGLFIAIIQRFIADPISLLILLMLLPLPALLVLHTQRAKAWHYVTNDSTIQNTEAYLQSGKNAYICGKSHIN